MGHSSIFRSHPHNYGPGSRICRVCSNGHGIIRKVNRDFSFIEYHLSLFNDLFILVWFDDLPSMLSSIFQGYRFQETRLSFVDQHDITI